MKRYLRRPFVPDDLMRQVLIASWLLLWGCSEDTPPAEPVDLDTARESLASAQCERVFECCSAEDAQRVFASETITDAAACVPVLDNYLNAFVFPAITDALDRGAVEIDTTAEAACIQTFRDVACESLVPNPNLNMLKRPECVAWVQPRLETSEFCTADFECKTGFCALSDSSGSCRPAPTNGEPCSQERCAEDAFCYDGVCAPKLALNVACSRNDECLSENCIEDSRSGRVCGSRAQACQGQ